MNAYELAEIMTVHDESRIWEHGLEIANTLRQQADEIIVLKRILADEGITVGYDYLNDCVAMLRKAKQ